MSRYVFRSPADAQQPAARQSGGKKKMSDTEVQNALHGLIADAVQFVDSELSPDRAKATEYYLGKPFGNEEAGRSQVVLTEVRDAVQGILPQLAKVFFSPEQVVEFVPRCEKDVEQAAQASDYVRYVFDVDNPGFLLTHSVWLDGLVRKLGVYKWAWVPAKTRAFHYKGLTESELQMLASDEGVEIVSVKPLGTIAANPDDTTNAPVAPGGPPAAAPGGPPAAAPAGPQAGAPAMPGGPQAGAPGAPAPMPAPAPAYPDDPDANDPNAQPTEHEQPGEQTFDVHLTRVEEEGRMNLWAVPPDEFLYSREARSIDDATLVAHRTERTRSDLIELGIDEKDIDEWGHRDLSIESNLEEQTRREATSSLSAGIEHDPESGVANQKILYTENWVYLDQDGDGIAELRRICTIGPAHHIVDNEPTSERPFALWCPSPEPHTITGQSWADRTEDIQRIKSFVFRATLDSAAASIFPRMAYVEGQVAVEDVLNTDIGAPIRMRQPGMVQPFVVPFLGQQMFPVMEYLDDVAERRTGQNKGAAGLDADALQSSTKAAVGAAVSSAQAQVELLARLFAEMTLKPLFRGMLRCLIENQPRARMVRLRSKWVPVDPRSWDAKMDVTVHVAVGGSFKEEKLATLAQIAEKQEQVISTYGPSNPLCGVGQYRNTLARMVQLEGFEDVHAFFNDVPLNWQPPQQQPQPSPAQVEAQTTLQVEQMKTQKDLQIKQMELQLKTAELAQKRDLELKKMADDFTLRRYQIDAQFKANYSEQQMEQDAQAQTNWLSRISEAHTQQLDRQQQAHDQAMAQHQRQMEMQQQGHDQSLAQDQQAHEQDMAERQTAAQEQAAQQQPGDGE